MFSWLANLFRKPAEEPRAAPPAAPTKTPPTVFSPEATIPVVYTGKTQPMKATPRVEVEINQSPEETSVRIKGDARVAEASILEAQLRGLQALRSKVVVIDLSQLNFISSLAMGVLVTCRRAILRNGGQVRFRPDLQDFVRTALGHAGLLEMFAIPATAAPATGQGPPAPS